MQFSITNSKIDRKWIFYGRYTVIHTMILLTRVSRSAGGTRASIHLSVLLVCLRITIVTSPAITLTLRTLRIIRCRDLLGWNMKKEQFCYTKMGQLINVEAKMQVRTLWAHNIVSMWPKCHPLMLTKHQFLLVFVDFFMPILQSWALSYHYLTMPFDYILMFRQHWGLMLS